MPGISTHPIVQAVDAGRWLLLQVDYGDGELVDTPIRKPFPDVYLEAFGSIVPKLPTSDDEPAPEDDAPVTPAQAASKARETLEQLEAARKMVAHVVVADMGSDVTVFDAESIKRVGMAPLGTILTRALAFGGYTKEAGDMVQSFRTSAENVDDPALDLPSV